MNSVGWCGTDVLMVLVRGSVPPSSFCLLLKKLGAGLQAKPCMHGMDEPVLRGKGDQSTVDKLVVAGPCSCIWSLVVHYLIYTRGIFFFCKPNCLASCAVEKDLGVLADI